MKQSDSVFFHVFVERYCFYIYHAWGRYVDPGKKGNVFKYCAKTYF